MGHSFLCAHENGLCAELSDSGHVLRIFRSSLCSRQWRRVSELHREMKREACNVNVFMYVRCIIIVERWQNNVGIQLKVVKVCQSLTRQSFS